MTVTIIAAVVGAVVGAVGTALVTWLASGRRLEQQQMDERRAHEALPAYERAARAYEQAAGRGGIIYASPEKSEEYYRQAARIRREAEEDMLAGRTPLTRPRDEEAEGQGGGRAAMGAVADYVRSRVARDHERIESCWCPRCTDHPAGQRRPFRVPLIADPPPDFLI